MDWYDACFVLTFAGIVWGAWYGQLTMDPYLFGRGRTKKQMYVGAAVMWTSLLFGFAVLIWRDR